MKILFVCLFLTGCANWTRMDCTQTIQTSTITWVKTDDPYQTCKELGAETLSKGGACISVAGDKATLHAQAPSKIDDAILGHEVKHAFGCNHA